MISNKKEPDRLQSLEFSEIGFLARFRDTIRGNPPSHKATEGQVRQNRTAKKRTVSYLTNKQNSVRIHASRLDNHITPFKKAVARYKGIYEDIYNEKLTDLQATE